MMSFGRASLIRFASSCAAKPPKATEWIAPLRAHASIAMIASDLFAPAGKGNALLTEGGAIDDL
jgi:hypothetical protein